jgi:tetratricopeptide (TPR) repeat protein
MRIAVVMVVGLVLVLALVPELNRYRGEHRLYRTTALFESMLKGQAAENRGAVFELAAASATDAAENLPGDSRPLIVAGSLRLFAHQPAEALALYRKALAVGERAEIDLNLGRAYEMLGNHPSASAAILRAAWVSPAIISALPDNLQAPLQSAIAQDEDLLRHHRLSAPPALPAEFSMNHTAR